MSQKEWYLIYTKPRQERVAVENLERQGYATYLPLRSLQKRRAGKYRLITEPLFPRYVFVALDAANDNWGPIRSTRGVNHLVNFGGVPAKVPKDFIAFLRQNEEAPEASAAPVFQRGESVRIVSGVMAGYEGIVAAASSDERITLLLELVGKTIRVQVPIETLDAVH